MRAIAIIPARGGSKRIPRKNVRNFHGKPIIAYSIEAALQCELFQDVIVSTDDVEIAKVAELYGATAPFLRPAELSDDYTGTTPVIEHGVRWYEEHVREVDAACCLYATAPFVKPEDLVNGFDELKTAEAAFSITSFPFPIFRALKMQEDGIVSLFWPEHNASRSQDLPEAWHDAGQFYWARKEFLFAQKEFMLGDAKGVKLPRHRVQDIDTEEDWIRAELLFSAVASEE